MSQATNFAFEHTSTCIYKMKQKKLQKQKNQQKCIKPPSKSVFQIGLELENKIWNSSNTHTCTCTYT